MEPELEPEPLCTPGRKLPGDYVVVRPLGKGSYGEVCVSDDNTNDKLPTRAVKIMPNHNYSTVSEVSLLSMLDHPHIIKPINIESDLSLVYMYMPIYDKQPSQKNFGTIINRLLSALAYIHSLGIMHADLKPGNIIWKYEDYPVIIDFGISVLVPGNKPRYLNAYPDGFRFVLQSSPFRAPEIWNEDAFTCNADVWSLGCILFQLLSGKMLFPTDNKDIFFKMVSDIPMRVSQNIPEQYRQIILSMLTVDPQKRPTSIQLLNAPVDVHLRNFIPSPMNKFKESTHTLDKLVSYFKEYMKLTQIVKSDEGVNAWLQMAMPLLQMYITHDSVKELNPTTEIYAKYIAYLLTDSSFCDDPTFRFHSLIGLYTYVLRI